MTGLVWLLYVGLLNTDFVFHLVIRFIAYSIAMGTGVYASSENEETVFVRSIIFNYLALFLVELIFYVQVK